MVFAKYLKTPRIIFWIIFKEKMGMSMLGGIRAIDTAADDNK